MALMKVLQDRQTLLYFKSIGSWRRDLKDAFVFETEEEAERFALDQGFANVQIVDITSTRTIVNVRPLAGGPPPA